MLFLQCWTLSLHRALLLPWHNLLESFSVVKQCLGTSLHLNFNNSPKNVYLIEGAGWRNEPFFGCLGKQRLMFFVSLSRHFLPPFVEYSLHSFPGFSTCPSMYLAFIPFTVMFCIQNEWFLAFMRNLHCYFAY